MGTLLGVHPIVPWIYPKKKNYPRESRVNSYDQEKTGVSFLQAFYNTSWNHVYQRTVIKDCFNTPLHHTPGNPPSQLWKKSLFSLLVKV